MPNTLAFDYWARGRPTVHLKKTGDFSWWRSPARPVLQLAVAGGATYTEAVSVALSVLPSALSVLSAVDTTQAVLVVLPSALDIPGKIISETASAIFTLLATSTDFRSLVDSGAVVLTLSPSAAGVLSVSEKPLATFVVLPSALSGILERVAASFSLLPSSRDLIVYGDSPQAVLVILPAATDSVNAAPILPSQLVLRGPLLIVESDQGPVGGAIHKQRRLTAFTWVYDMGFSNIVSVESSGSDTRVVTITGRLTDGRLDRESITLQGATPVTGFKKWDYILKAEANSARSDRTVTVKKWAPSAQSGTIEPGDLMSYETFVGAVSDPGVPKANYEKAFWHNANQNATLRGAKVVLVSDPQSRVKIALAASQDDSGQVADRLTSPGLTFSDDGVELSVPGTDIGPDSAIGVWVEMTMVADAPPVPVGTIFATALEGTSP